MENWKKGEVKRRFLPLKLPALPVGEVDGLVVEPREWHGPGTSRD